MREFCMSGSVGAPAEQSLGRPDNSGSSADVSELQKCWRGEAPQIVFRRTQSKATHSPHRCRLDKLPEIRRTEFLNTIGPFRSFVIVDANVGFRVANRSSNCGDSVRLPIPRTDIEPSSARRRVICGVKVVRNTSMEDST